MNDHHVETTCRAQYLGRYLEGQGHSMTFKQNSFRPITFLIWSRILQLFHRNDHHLETTCHEQHLSCYLEGQGHSMKLQHNRVWPKTLFDVGFHNYFWQTTFDKLLLCVQYLFGKHYPVLTGSCLIHGTITNSLSFYLILW